MRSGNGSGNRTVVGANAGDEGKGKEVDCGSQEVDYVARYEGGANAGHTIRIGGFEFIGHLLPSGAFAGIRCMLTQGVRIDVDQILSEVDDFSVKTGKAPDLGVSEGAFLVFQWHKIIEWWVERAKQKRLVYTTMRGMCGVAASIGLRIEPKVAMLYAPEELNIWLEDFYRTFQTIFEHPDTQKWIQEQYALKKSEWDHVLSPTEMMAVLLTSADQLEQYVCNSRLELYTAWRCGQKILFEGAQGLMLDPYWGTWGYNTQGLCTFAGASVGSGLPVQAIGRQIGVTKAVASRVGWGPFPTELGDPLVTDKEARIPNEQKEGWLHEMRDKINAGWATDQEVGQYLRVKGGEFGATSGRPRRTGWYDSAWLEYFAQVTGPHEMSLTKLDCYSGLKRLRVCVAYKLDGRQLDPGEIPALSSVFGRVEPVYVDLDGWEEDITGETQFESLPARARRFVEVLDRAAYITRIGTGPDRAHVISRNGSQ